jgi:hypothetical protein
VRTGPRIELLLIPLWTFDFHKSQESGECISYSTKRLCVLPRSQKQPSWIAVQWLHGFFGYFIKVYNISAIKKSDRLCGLVVRVPGYRSRDPVFDSRRYKIIWEVLGLERGPLSLTRITEELLEWKSSGSGSRKLRLTAVGICCADHATPFIRKSWH